MFRPFLFLPYFSGMNRIIVLLFVIFAFSSCTKCWNCRQPVTIEVDGKEIETDSYFEEDVCDKKEKEELELDDFECAPKR